MSFYEYVIDLITLYFSSGFTTYFFYPFLMLSFIACCPFIIRYFFRR